MRWFFAGDDLNYAVVANEALVSATREPIPPPSGPSRLATIEEWLVWLQADFMQLAPDLLSTTTGLYQLKDSVERIKRRPRACQARHWPPISIPGSPTRMRHYLWVISFLRIIGGRRYDHVNDAILSSSKLLNIVSSLSIADQMYVSYQ